MQLGTYVDGQPLNYDEQAGTFAVGGWTIPPDRVQALSDADKVTWVNDETRSWFYSAFVVTPPVAIPASTVAPAPPTTRPTRLGVPVLVAAAVIVLALIGGAVWWISFTRSPGYSLGQLANAVQNKDWDGVQKYVDIESVTNKLVDAAMSKALADDTSGFGALAAGLAQSLKPALVQEAKDAIRKSIEQGSGSSGGGLDSAAGFLAANRIKSITYIGDEALVTIQVPDGDKTFDLKLRMKRVDNFWRVTAIENFLDIPGANGQ